MEKIQACIFARVSTFKQDAERQIEQLQQFCSQRGYNVSKVISTTISGVKTRKNRPDIIELLDAAKRHEFDKVICSELSRLGRNGKDIRDTLSALHELKIPVVFHSLGELESLDEHGQESFVTNVIMAIYSELAQEEKHILSERTLSGLAHARAQGRIGGRPAGQKESMQKFMSKHRVLITKVKENRLSD